MKKNFTLLTLLFITLMFSQRPSSTEKWNPTLKRYEYFDSNGKITGYKKYDERNAQWEIIDFQKNPESYIGGNSAYSDGPRKRKVVDLEYPSLSASDIEYAKAMAAAQVRQENTEAMANQEYYKKRATYLSSVNDMKAKINENISIIKSKILADSYLNSNAYKSFFDEIMPEAIESVNSSNYTEVRWAYLTTEQVIENYKQNSNWFH